MTYQAIAPRTFLKTSTGGSQSYVYRYTIGGQTQEKGLGSATGAGRVMITEAQALKRATILNGILATGQDPFAKTARKQMTFGEIYNEQKDMKKRKWTVDFDGETIGSEKEWDRSLEKDLAKLAKMQFNHPGIEQAVEDAIAPHWPGKKGDNLQNRIMQTFKRAKVRKLWTGDNPADRARIVILLGEGRDTRSKEDGGDVKNIAMVPIEQVPVITAALRALTGEAAGPGADATEFMIETIARTSNVLKCRKADINLEAGTWTIQAGSKERGLRMKNGKSHTFYLSARAIEIARANWDKAGEFLFTNGGGKPLGETALREKLVKPTNRGGLALVGVTSHGFRSSFSTWALASFGKVYGDIADAMIAHSEGKTNSKVQKVYQRADAETEMRALSSAWGKHCAGIKLEDNVVTLRHLKAA